ncbi:MAG: hypothetical protein ACREIT_02415, partial [Tepidisphaeraceae bacterium]
MGSGRACAALLVLILTASADAQQVVPEPAGEGGALTRLAIPSPSGPPAVAPPQMPQAQNLPLGPLSP